MKRDRRSVGLFGQQGVVLVVALVMLLVMTTIGVTIMSGSTLQERMSGNNRQLSLARLNAESALREAEGLIAGLNLSDSADPVGDINTRFGTQNDQYYVSVVNEAYSDYEPVRFDVTEPSAWVVDPDNLEQNPSAGATGLGVGTPPRYIIEFIGEMSIEERRDIEISVEDKDKIKTVPYVFRVTAIGYGANNNISAILQSIYATEDNP